jgi:hypothetical protein
MKDDSTRVELAAIPIVAVVLGVLLVLVLAYSLGLWAWLLVGAAALVLGAIVLRVAGRRRLHPPVADAPPTGSAAAGTRSDPRTYRVLVVADESCTDPAFPARLREHAAGRPLEVLVVAPALGSWLARWTDDDRRQAEAQRHLDDTTRALEAAGVAARGITGPDDPIQAADDGLRQLAADEVVFVTAPEDRARWLEHGVIEAARARYAVPVTHVVLETDPRSTKGAA